MFDCFQDCWVDGHTVRCPAPNFPPWLGSEPIETLQNLNIGLVFAQWKFYSNLSMIFDGESLSRISVTEDPSVASYANDVIEFADDQTVSLTFTVSVQEVNKQKSHMIVTFDETQLSFKVIFVFYHV